MNLSDAFIERISISTSQNKLRGTTSVIFNGSVLDYSENSYLSLSKTYNEKTGSLPTTKYTGNR